VDEVGTTGPSAREACAMVYESLRGDPRGGEQPRNIAASTFAAVAGTRAKSCAAGGGIRSSSDRWIHADLRSRRQLDNGPRLAIMARRRRSLQGVELPRRLAACDRRTPGDRRLARLVRAVLWAISTAMKGGPRRSLPGLPRLHGAAAKPFLTSLYDDWKRWRRMAACAPNA